MWSLTVLTKGRERQPELHLAWAIQGGLKSFNEFFIQGGCGICGSKLEGVEGVETRERLRNWR